MAFERVGVRVTLEGVQRFRRDAAAIRRDISGMGRVARGLTAPFRLAGTAISKFAGFLGGVARIAGGIIAAGIFFRVARGLSMIAGEALRAAAEFQKLEIRFEGLIARELAQADATLTMVEALEMAKKPAQDLLEWIKRIAVTTPFTVESLSNATSMAMAMGFNTEKAKELTLAIGNFVAGMGLSDEVMQRIIYNFGQMIQQGKVTGTELRDLARGSLVPVTDVLHLMQEQLGDKRPWEDFREAAAKGKVPVEAFFESFMTIANRDFPGAMERMSMTWQGVTSNIKDFIQAVLGVDLLGPVVDRFTRRAAEWLQRMMSPDMRRDIKSLGRSLDIAFMVVTRTLNRDLIPAIKGFFSMIGLGDLSISSFSTLITRAMLAISRFITRISEWVTFVTERLSEIRDWILEKGPTMFEPFITSGKKLLTALQEEIFPLIEEEIREFLDWAKEEIPLQIEGIGTNIETALDALLLTWERHGADVVGVMDKALATLTISTIGSLELYSGWIAGFLQGLTGDWEGAWETIKRSSKTFWEGVLSIADLNIEEYKAMNKKLWEDMVTIVSYGVEQVYDTISQWLDDFVQLGADIILGIMDGISNVVHLLYDLIDDIIERIYREISRLLGLGSPSKVYQAVGHSMMEGLAKGILDAARLPELAVSMAATRTTATALAASPISRSVSTSNYFNMTVNTRAPVEPIIADFRTLQSIAGAI